MPSSPAPSWTQAEGSFIPQSSLQGQAEAETVTSSPEMVTLFIPLLSSSPEALTGFSQSTF